MNHSSLITAIASVQRLEGVAGAMLFKGKNAIHRQMPFSDGRALDLMDVLAEMLDGYRQVKRRIRQVYLQFEGGALLILVQEQTALVFFLTSRSDVDLVASAGTVLLRDFAGYLASASDRSGATPALNGSHTEELIAATPRSAQQLALKDEARVNNWGTLRKQIESLLGKVMGRAQVNMMIDRVILKRGIDDPYRLPFADLKALAVALIEQVPNTAKRQALMSELESVLVEHQN
jgi:hypothetical protein